MSYSFNKNYWDITYKYSVIRCFIRMIITAWCGFWLTNIVSYLGIFSISGFLINAFIGDANMLDEPSFAYRFWEFVFFAIGNGWMYITIIVACLAKLDDSMISKQAKIVFSAFFTCLIICIYDPRWSEFLPYTLHEGIAFLRDTCKFCLIGGINIFDFDFSGLITNNLYYIYFDISLLIGMIFYDIMYD